MDFEIPNWLIIAIWTIWGALTDREMWSALPGGVPYYAVMS